MKKAPDEPLPTVALSIQQPWAWAIVNGGKTIENRTWRTRFRGAFLIHASQRFDNDGERFVLGMCPDLPGRDQLPRGGIVGVAELFDCVTRSDNEWFFGPVGFVLRNARPLPFMPCRGHLSFFEVSL